MSTLTSASDPSDDYPLTPTSPQSFSSSDHFTYSSSDREDKPTSFEQTSGWDASRSVPSAWLCDVWLFCTPQPQYIIALHNGFLKHSFPHQLWLFLSSMSSKHLNLHSCNYTTYTSHWQAYSWRWWITGGLVPLSFIKNKWCTIKQTVWSICSICLPNPLSLALLDKPFLILPFQESHCTPTNITLIAIVLVLYAFIVQHHPVYYTFTPSQHPPHAASWWTHFIFSHSFLFIVLSYITFTFLVVDWIGMLHGVCFTLFLWVYLANYTIPHLLPSTVW